MPRRSMRPGSAECSTAVPQSSNPEPGPVPQSTQGVGIKVARAGSGRPHIVLTVIVGGSREAVIHAMDSKAQDIFIQEHRIAGPCMVGIQAAAMAKGWHGMWDLAEASGPGRSGGTAVLVRRPVHIFRGAAAPRATVGVICWTRRTRAHFVSAYGAPDTDRDAHEKTQSMMHIM